MRTFQENFTAELSKWLGNNPPPNGLGKFGDYIVKCDNDVTKALKKQYPNCSVVASITGNLLTVCADQTRGKTSDTFYCDVQNVQGVFVIIGEGRVNDR